MTGRASTSRVLDAARRIAAEMPIVENNEAMWHACAVCGKGLAMDEPDTHESGCAWVELRAALAELDARND